MEALGGDGSRASTGGDGSGAPDAMTVAPGQFVAPGGGGATRCLPSFRKGANAPRNADGDLFFTPLGNG